MITFKPVVLAHHQRRDGTYPVKVRITYKGVHRYLATNLTAKPYQLTRSCKIKDNTLIARCNEMCDTMRAAVANLNYFALERMTVDDVVQHIRRAIQKDTFSLEFFSWGRFFISKKKESTRKTYESALSKFAAFAGEPLEINSISKTMVQEWYDSMLSQIAGTTANQYYFRIKTLFEKAKEHYNDEGSGVIVISRNPFCVKIRRAFSEGQPSLPVEVIQAMIDDRSEGRTRQVLDLLLLSFCLMGVNLADLWDARIPKTTWEYNRKKTADSRPDRAYMRVIIQEPARYFISTLSADGFVLGKIRREYKINSFVHIIAIVLDEWCKSKGIEPFRYYAMRHSWATIARRLGIEKATVEECLTHIGDFPMTDIYAERNWELINEANRSVLRLFAWRG